MDDYFKIVQAVFLFNERAVWYKLKRPAAQNASTDLRNICRRNLFNFLPGIISVKMRYD